MDWIPQGYICNHPDGYLPPEVKALIKAARGLRAEHEPGYLDPFTACGDYAYVEWGELFAALDACKDIPCE
jgi:hypothetical protein